MTQEDRLTSVGLICPACRIDLVMTERHSIEIDYCPKCRGVWLDRGELDKIIEKAAGPSQEPLERQSRYAGSHHAQERDSRHGYRRKSWLSELFD